VATVFGDIARMGVDLDDFDAIAQHEVGVQMLRLARFDFDLALQPLFYSARDHGPFGARPRVSIERPAAPEQTHQLLGPYGSYLSHSHDHPLDPNQRVPQIRDHNVNVHEHPAVADPLMRDSVLEHRARKALALPDKERVGPDGRHHNPCHLEHRFSAGQNVRRPEDAWKVIRTLLPDCGDYFLRSWMPHVRFPSRRRQQVTASPPIGWPVS
jgi:hypothetical protein